MKSILMLLLFLMCSITHSQSLKLFDVNASNFPTIQGKIYSFDSQGRQLRPSVSDLIITENGIARTISSVSCPPPVPPKALSSVLVIDVSGSMDWGINDKNINLAKSAANAWVNALSLGTSECAITTFDHSNYLNQDFTVNRQKLLTAISQLQPQGGTDYDAALINPMSGGLVVSAKGIHKRVIVLLTDGLAVEPNKQQIIQEANRQNCSIYCVTLGMSAPQSLLDIASQTGGEVFDNVTTTKDAEHVYNRILQVVQGAEPCTIEWQSSTSCGNNISSSVELRSIPQNVTANATFMLPNSAQVRLNSTPLPLRFDNPPIGVPTVQTLTITASNSSFIVSNIVSSNPAFTVSPTSFTLQPNQSQNVDVTYTAVDSGYTFTKLTIQNNVCEQSIFISGGYKGKKSKTQTLKLTFPNGGETFVVGSDSIIRWEGIPSTDVVKLEYSTNNGSSWIVIDTASGLSYTWSNIPRPISAQCILRVKQLEPKSSSSTDSVSTIITGSARRIIFDIEFSPDGDNFAYAYPYSEIKVWNMATSQLIRTLSGHTDNVRDVAFSPDGSKFVSGGDDKTIKFWNLNTGQVLRTLSGHTGQVYKVAFSPNGNVLASGSGDFTIKIWDPNTGINLHTLYGHSGKVYCTAFSPDGSILATAGQDSTVKLWDPYIGQELRTLRLHNNYINALAFSPDGNLIATSDYYSLKLWDLNTGQIVHTLNNGEFSCLAFSPDGNKLATGSYDSTVKIWDPITGRLLSTLRHTNYIGSIAFSPDGNILASCVTDTVIKLWSIDAASIQSDKSDAVFSIVDPLPASQNIIMGESPLGSSKDSLVVDFINNIGTWKFSVDSIYIRGSDAGAFSLISGIPTYTIEANSSHFGEFSFTPIRVGVHSAEIVIITQSDTLIQTISGIGVEQSIEVIGQTIDFGVLEIGKLKDTLQTVTIRNSGSVPITILGTTHSLPNTTDFTTISGGGSFTLAPNETHLMDLRFIASDVGRTSGTLKFTYNGFGSPAIVQLFGEGVSIMPTTLRVSKSEAFPGDNIEIPIMVTNAQNLVQAGISSIDVILSFNPSILYPKGYSVTAVNDTLATITVNNLLVNYPSGISEIRIPFVVMLGNADSCTLGIEQVIPQGGAASINTFNGVFKLLGICREGGTRFVLGNSLPYLVKVMPNPSDGNVEIDVTVIEKGTSTMRIFSSNGSLMEEHRFTTLGNKKVAIDSRAYSDGLYFITLQTPTTFDTAKLLIVK